MIGRMATVLKRLLYLMLVASLGIIAHGLHTQRGDDGLLLAGTRVEGVVTSLSGGGASGETIWHSFTLRYEAPTGGAPIERDFSLHTPVQVGDRIGLIYVPPHVDQARIESFVRGDRRGTVVAGGGGMYLLLVGLPLLIDYWRSALRFRYWWKL